MTGWKEDFLQQAVNTCTNPSGRIEDCPIFDVVDQGTATSCKMASSMPQPLLSENVLGPRAGLPGGVKITGDGGTSDGGNSSEPSGTTGPRPTLSYSPGEMASAKASPLPGQIFKAQNEAAGTAGASKANIPAAQALPTQPPAAASPSPSFVSTQYITNGNMVTEILWEEDVVTVTKGVKAAAQPTPAQYKRHVHMGGHAHRKQ